MKDIRGLGVASGLLVFAVFAMGQAMPECDAPPAAKATATAVPPKASAVVTAAPTSTAAPPKATAAATTATAAAAAAPIGAAPSGASTLGWDHPPLAIQFVLAPPYLSVGIACAKGLPPGARVQLRLSGAAGPPATAEGVVAADGSLTVPFGIQRAAEVIWEVASITPTSGAAPSTLPAGARGAVTLPADKPC